MSGSNTLRDIMPRRQHLRGAALVAAAALLWSTGGLIVRSLQMADTWTTVFWRSAWAFAFLAAFIAVRERGGMLASFARMGWPGLVVACCYAAASTALIVAFKLTSVANVLVIMSSAPLLTGVLGWLTIGERVRPASWVAMALSVAGIAVMVSGAHASGSIAGEAAASVVAVGLAVGGVVIRRWRHVQMAPAMCASTLVTLLVAAPLASPTAVTARDMLLLFLFGTVQLGLGLALFSYGAPLIPAAEVALLNVLDPVCGPLWVWLVLGEAPGRGALVGGVIVLAALALHILTGQHADSR